MKRTLLAGMIWVIFTVASFGQTPPPNDNFANRTLLTGSTVNFSGTLDGATLESNETLGTYVGNLPGPILRSVWWTWSAPQTSLVTVEMTGASADTPFQDGIAIYDTTNVFSPVVPVAETGLDISIMYNALTFSATQGSNYQIQMLGRTSNSYQFLLLATNPPVIFQGPRSLTVSSNESQLFTVVAEGYRPLSYQWQHSGANLPGQTAAMLALTNIDGSQAGNYTVVVSNVGGSITSEPALLTVSTAVAPPFLVPIGGRTGSFAFGLSGEVGRNYRIESSTDLVAWTNEFSFQRVPYNIDDAQEFPNVTSVVFDTNGDSVFGVNESVAAKFIRASQYQPANEICINNLRQIRFAKALWLRDDKIAPWRDDTPYGRDIAPYFLQGVLPHCPLDTNASYIDSYNAGIGKCEDTPACSILPNSHILEEP